MPTSPQPPDVEPRFVNVLRQLAELRRGLDQLEFDTVALVRECGVTWEQIGDELGISRQAARSRFSKAKPRRITE